MEWLDQKVLRQLAEDIGQEMMPVVISVFIEEVGEQLTQLRPLYERRDWPALARLAHSMKSSCGSYGAQLSYQQVVALELACKHEDADEVACLLTQLEQSLPQVLSHLANYH
ncbi:Hpt domain-containing protein [Aeromonas salmonicida]|uniref:Hpt domain-containing protein n=1 Tax=Aeromonas salmonicida TaxID=645 RepID=UPI0024A92600|nr:Hpt domain-containing protein [Aeromonas salmonicida]MDM5135779.1 Hpt domain-containing protein [Aeromonas salmonicida]WHF42884.1 Hpt domain-containing protein [Aeromonas salmonicida]